MPSKKLSPPEASLPKSPPAPVQASSAAKDRSDRLAQLRLAITEGTYRIPAETVADKVVDLLKKRLPNA